MNTTAITVIVPVYHGAVFLKECLSSLRKQDFSLPYQVVLMDCSAEKDCADLAREYERIDNRFFYYRREENLGPGYSRSLGMFHAAGEYVTFVDGDDIVEENYLSCLYKMAKKTDADVVTGGYYLFSQKRRINGYSRVHKTLSGQKVLKKIYRSAFMKYRTFCWGRLIKKTLLFDNGIFFDKDLQQFEDWYFMNAVFYHAKKTVFIKKPLYGYRQSQNSIMNDYHKRFEYHETAIEKSKEYILKRDDKFAEELFDRLRFPIRCQLKFDLKNCGRKQKKEELNKAKMLFFKR